MTRSARAVEGTGSCENRPEAPAYSPLEARLGHACYAYLIPAENNLSPIESFQSFGFLGLILGPVVFGVITAAFQIYEEEYEDKQEGLLLPGNGVRSEGEEIGRSPR